MSLSFILSPFLLLDEKEPPHGNHQGWWKEEPAEGHVFKGSMLSRASTMQLLTREQKNTKLSYARYAVTGCTPGLWACLWLHMLQSERVFYLSVSELPSYGSKEVSNLRWTIYVGQVANACASGFNGAVPGKGFKKQIKVCWQSNRMSISWTQEQGILSQGH